MFLAELKKLSLKKLTGSIIYSEHIDFGGNRSIFWIEFCKIAGRSEISL